MSEGHAITWIKILGHTEGCPYCTWRTIIYMKTFFLVLTALPKIVVGVQFGYNTYGTPKSHEIDFIGVRGSE